MRVQQILFVGLLILTPLLGTIASHLTAEVKVNSCFPEFCLGYLPCQ